MSKPMFFAVPIELHTQMLRADLDPATRDLNLAAWSYVALHQTDAVLTQPEIAHLPSNSKRRVQALIDAGFWSKTEERYEVVGYLEGGLNKTKAEIEESRARSRRSTQKSSNRKEKRAADAGPPDESDDGQLT